MFPCMFSSCPCIKLLSVSVLLLVSLYLDSVQLCSQVCSICLNSLLSIYSLHLSLFFVVSTQMVCVVFVSLFS